MINPKRFADEFPRGSEHSNDREFRRNIDSNNKVMKKLGQINTTFPTDESEHPLKKNANTLAFETGNTKSVTQPAKHRIILVE
ncbi:hypothetical protein [Desulfitobacterium hafniense]|nr:hypothetical protein [Desulfitobacterium hafniense]